MTPTEFFHQLSSQNLGVVNDFYQPSAVLVDPIGLIGGNAFDVQGMSKIVMELDGQEVLEKEQKIMLNPMLDLLFICWEIMSFVMVCLWYRQLKTQNANSVDVAWALGFWVPALVGIFNLLSNPLVVSWRVWLVAVMVGVWSLRLGGYLFSTRVVNASGEDARYRRLRTESGWGRTAFFVMYQFQALLVVVLSVPLFAAMTSPQREFGYLDAAAVIVWGVAIAGESLADFQLHRFKKDPQNRGKTCQAGLWNHTRHPNYFFEWLHWWAYVLLAIGTINVWYALVGPVVMIWFLLKVTGVRATEAQCLRTRADYAQYQRTTSAFVPWFRKS